MKLVSNTLILALGPVGYWIAETYQKELRTRHPNHSTPTIEILALLEEGQAEEMSLPSLIIQPKEERELETLLSSLYPHYITQGANAAQLLNNVAHQPRLRGQISLHQHIYAIEQKLQDIHKKITSINTIKTLTDQNVVVVNPNQTHIFVLLSLADTFMTGLMPDLAYVIQNSLKTGVSHDSFIHIHPLFFMPGFEGEINLNAHDPQQIAELEFRINAQAAACLKEVDYHLAQGHSYYHRFNSQLSIEGHHSPLGNGQIYLIEPANEKQHRLANVTSLANHVSTWLYHVTVTPLHNLLDSPVMTRGAIYGSFGDATLSVPIGPWIERATTQLQLDLLQQLLQPSAKTLTPIDISNTRARLHLTEQDIRNKLTKATEYEELTIPSSFALRVPQTKPTNFLNGIQTRYSSIMHEKMPQLRDDLFRHMHHEITERDEEQDAKVIGELKNHVQNLLNDLGGGLNRTAVFLEKLHDTLQQENKELTTTQKELMSSGKTLQQTIDDRRQTYFNEAQVAAGIGSISFMRTIFLILAGGAPILALSWHFYQNYEPMWGIAMLVSAISAAMLILSSAYSSLHTSRYRVIQSYDQRLRAFREANLLLAMLRLYEEIINWIGGIRAGVGELPQKLMRIRAQLTDHQEEEQLNDATRFSGIMPGTISESLLTPQLITELEQKARTAGFEGEIEAMRQQLGTPHQWIKEEWQEEQLAHKLKKFAHKRLSQQLRQYDLDQLLKTLSPLELEAKLTRMIQMSQPYWQHNDAQVPPHQVVALANPENHRQLLEQLLPHYQIQSIDNQFELVMATIRHGFRLSQVNTFTELLMSDYQALARREPDALHTTIERRILPTPSPYANDISLLKSSVRHLCAIALGIKIIYEDFDGFYWEDETMRENKLNGTLIEIALEMERDQKLQAAIRSATLKKYDRNTSPNKLQRLINSIDFDNPLYPIWVILAIQDFLQYESQFRL